MEAQIGCFISTRPDVSEDAERASEREGPISAIAGIARGMPSPLARRRAANTQRFSFPPR